jgi:hypothetical protein
MHLSKGFYSKTGPIISLHISSVMNVRKLVHISHPKKKISKNIKQGRSYKNAFAQAALERSWSLLKLLWSTNIFTVSFIRPQSTYIPTVEYRSVCHLTGTGTPPSPLPQDTLSFLSLTASHLCHQDLG